MLILRPLLAVIAATLWALVLLETAAHAQSDPLKCQRAVLKETTKFFKAKLKALQKCEERKAKGKAATLVPPGLGTPCATDSKTAAKIAKATSKLGEGIDKKCGGPDKVCGNGDDDLDLQGDLGFPATCPFFEGNCGLIPLDRCDDLADCLECIGMDAIDQLVPFLYADLDQSVFGAGDDPDKSVNKCQIAIGKEVAKFALAKQKTIGKCWDARYKAKHAAQCPDGGANPTTDEDAVKASAKVARSESKKIARICKACGGDDKDCDDPVTAVNPGTPALGGSDPAPDDIALGDIFAGAGPFNCPAVVAPARPDRGAVDCTQKNPMTTLADLVFCVDCVAEFKVDCLNPAAVTDSFGGVAVVPSQCFGPTPTPTPTATPTPTVTSTAATPTPTLTTTPTPGPPCPMTLQLDGGNGDAVDEDLGWTGLGHDMSGPLLGRVTLGVDNCAGAGVPCGECELSGPIANVTGHDNQRCTCDSSVACTADTDCPGACPCLFFLGPPQPVGLGGVGVCFRQEIRGSVTGTTNVESGSTALTLPVDLRVFVGASIDNPCPFCEGDGTANDGIQGGTCDLGARAGLTCDANATSALFDNEVSFDCPSLPGANISLASLTLPVATGTRTVTLSAANPSCTALGFTASQCFCSSCDNPAAEACFTDAECPVTGACAGGTNAGEYCLALSDCPDQGGGTSCATQAGTCGGPRCLGGGALDGAPCGSLAVPCSFAPFTPCAVRGTATRPHACTGGTPSCSPTGGNEGECPTGPFTFVCSPTQTFRSCTFDSDCPLAGDTCDPVARECFLDNGVIGGAVQVDGVASVASPVLGALACHPPTIASAVNDPFGFPGLARFRVPTTATLF